jgi:hypothetical protein
MGAACLLCVAGAHAEPELRPSAARLEYVRGRGAERCPDASFLRAEVARVAGADPFRDDAPLLISATIERHGAELVASLALTSSGKDATADPSEPLRFEVGLGATAGLGITPGIAAGTTLAVGVRWSDWSVAVEGRGLVSLAKEVEGMTLGTTA